MRITLKDIAKEADVSTTAVSLVLNEQPNRIAPKTKQKILDTAHRLNYYPNQIAVALIKKQTNTIGLIIPDISNAFFSQLALGVDQEAHKHKKQILLINSGIGISRDIESLQVLGARGVDAVIICISGDARKENMAKLEAKIRSMPMPVVMVDRHEPDLYCSSVSLNNNQGGYIATEHLLQLGHRRILFVTGPKSLSTTQLRLKGCSIALHQYGLHLCEDDVLEGDFSFNSGIVAAESILHKDYTAAFLFNDFMAYGFCNTLVKEGYKIPQDISVVGFDDAYFSQLFQTPLTTVKQPVYDMGCAAVEAALEEIKNESKTKKMISFEPELIIRDSTTGLTNLS